MHTNISKNIKPTFEIDALMVLRFNDGELQHKFNLTKGDVSIFIDDLLGMHVDGLELATGGLEMEDGSRMYLAQEGDDLLVSSSTNATPVRVSKENAQALYENLEPAADCFEAISGLDADDGVYDDDFHEDGEAPTDDVAFVTEEELAERDAGVVKLA